LQPLELRRIPAAPNAYRDVPGVNQLLDFQINQTGSRRKVCEGPLDLVAPGDNRREDHVPPRNGCPSIKLLRGNRFHRWPLAKNNTRTHSWLIRRPMNFDFDPDERLRVLVVGFDESINALLSCFGCAGCTVQGFFFQNRKPNFDPIGVRWNCTFG
jgi:hypothetical protein